MDHPEIWRKDVIEQQTQLQDTYDLTSFVQILA